MQKLTEEDRARIIDSKHSIQEATVSLAGVDPTKIPKVEEIEECLENATKTLHGVLSK